MGMFSWRCAKTTKGIPIMRYQLTEVIAFLPDGQRISGFVGNYGELHQAEPVDKDNQPLPDSDHFPEGMTKDVFELYAAFLTPPAKPGPDGSYAMSAIEQMESLIKLVRVEEVEPDDQYDTLGISERCPWQGDYEYPEQWMLDLDRALAFEETLQPASLQAESDMDDGPGLS